MTMVPAGMLSDLEDLATAIRSECRHINSAPANDAEGSPVGCDTCDEQAHRIDMAYVVVYDLSR